MGTTRRQSNNQVNGKVHHLRDQKKARQVQSNVKTMSSCFFDIKGLIHFQFIPQGQTVNQQFYLEILKPLRDAVRRKCPELWRSGEWLLHHDDAPAHTALSVRQFLMKNGMITASHPPFSLDLATCNVFLFPRMKRDLKGKRFQNVEEVRKKTMEALKAVTLQEFQNCFDQWKKWWDKFIDSQGEYFEGD